MSKSKRIKDIGVIESVLAPSLDSMRADVFLNQKGQRLRIDSICSSTGEASTFILSKSEVAKLYNIIKANYKIGREQNCDCSKTGGINLN